MSDFDFRQFSSPAELADAAAGQWMRAAAEAAKHSRLHCVAISGGRIATTLFGRFSARAKAEHLPLDHMHVFWADERCVPPEHPDSNFTLAQSALFEPLHIASKNIHRLKGELPPGIAVAEANAEIRRVVPSNSEGFPVLDLILLGMGEDGHVASLFPNASPDVLECPTPYVVVTNAPKPPPNRISLSYASIAAARQVWVLISGPGKQASLRESLTEQGITPLAQVLRFRNNTTLFTDIRL